jgi:hypothetical protein
VAALWPCGLVVFILGEKKYRVTQKTGTFEKPNKNCRNPRKILLTEIEPLQLAVPLNGEVVCSSRSPFRSAAN